MVKKENIYPYILWEIVIRMTQYLTSQQEEYKLQIRKYFKLMYIGMLIAFIGIGIGFYMSILFVRDFIFLVRYKYILLTILIFLFVPGYVLVRVSRLKINKFIEKYANKSLKDMSLNEYRRIREEVKRR
jgi:hypothetical protein